MESMRSLEGTGIANNDVSTRASGPDFVSVVIPTYNRVSLLRAALDALSVQTWPAEKFEVIVVDDGSSDQTAAVHDEDFQFRIRYLRQENSGDAAARNLGARKSQADILAFLDDDVLVEPDYLSEIVRVLRSSNNLIVVGNENSANSIGVTRFQILHYQSNARSDVGNISFVELCSNSMSLKRMDYFTIGMMSGLGIAGSDMWCDVDFAYRASKKGFTVHRVKDARYRHEDRISESLRSYRERTREASSRAAALFQNHPDLSAHLPMFRDKLPIDWSQDPAPLMARKLTRKVLSSPKLLSVMEWLLEKLERHFPKTSLLRPLYRWVVGGHIYIGYREGLSRFSAR